MPCEIFLKITSQQKVTIKSNAKAALAMKENNICNYRTSCAR